MVSYPVFTSLDLPALAISPSATTLQWSADGQALLLTENAVYLLTPDLGISVDKSSVLKQTLNRNLLLGKRQIGWFRTLIARPKVAPEHLYSWANDCHEWAAVSFGPLDQCLRAVVFSPSNLTPTAGSVLVVLDSNMETTMYKASKDHFTGEWNKIGDLNEILADTGEDMDVDSDTRLRQTLCRQSTCMAWSPQADFGVSPFPDVDGSILAIGNRAGSVTLLRYGGESEGQKIMQHLTRVSIGDRWVTRLAWSRFTALSPGNTQSYLACALGDGSIVIVKVVQSLTQEDEGTQFTPLYNVTLSPEIMGDTACHADRRDTSSLQWIDVPEAEPVLVFSKPGVVHVWPIPSPLLSWSGLRSVTLKTQKLSVGSTAFSQLTGCTYSSAQDTLIVALADGSFHAIRPVIKDTAGPSYDPAMSEHISKTARSIFVNVKETKENMENKEKKKMTTLDVNAVHAMKGYDGGSTLIWVHEDFRPTNFSYKHEAKRTAMLMAAQLWDETSDDVCLQGIAEMLAHARPSGDAPLSVLRPILLHLHDPARLARVAEGLLDLLKGTQSHDDSASLAIPAWTGEFTPAFREQFRRSLRVHIFGRASLLSQRLRIMLASYCLKQSEDSQIRNAYGQVLGDAVSTLWHRLLRIIIRHIAAVLPLLTPSDIPFVLRIVVQSMLPGTPPDIEAEAQALSSAAQANVQQGDAPLGLAEACPACHAEVPLKDIASATCPNGHVWPRCSITSFILSSPMVRTCMSCSRKAFLPPPLPPSPAADGVEGEVPPPPNWLPPSARSWVVEDLLRSVRRCLVCSGNFVTLV